MKFMKKTITFIVLFTMLMAAAAIAQEKKIKVIEYYGGGFDEVLKYQLGNDRYEIDSIVLISKTGLGKNWEAYLRDCCENGRLTGIDMSRYTGLLGIVPNAFMSQKTEDDGVTPRRINLKYVTLPNSLKWIGKNAFAYTNLECIEIPTCTDSVCTGAFSGCANLKDVTFRGTDLRRDADGKAFAEGLPQEAVLHVSPGLGNHYRNSDSWKLFSEVREEEALFKSLDINIAAGKCLSDVVDVESMDVDSVHVTGVLSEADLALLKEKVLYGHLASLDLSGCEMGEDGELWNCDICYLRMPIQMEIIFNSFLSRSYVRHLVLPESYDKIGSGTFYLCDAFPDGTFTVAEGCRRVDFQAFYGCRTIHKMVLPSTLDALEPQSLYFNIRDDYRHSVDLYVNRMYPPELTQYMEAGDRVIDIDDLYGPFGCCWPCDDNTCVTKTWRLYVPVGAKQNYENTEHWNHFKEIIETPLLTGTSTGINEAQATLTNGAADGIYTLDGRIVSKATSTESLPRGLYIVRENGLAHKVVMGR